MWLCYLNAGQTKRAESFTALFVMVTRDSTNHEQSACHLMIIIIIYSNVKAVETGGMAPGAGFEPATIHVTGGRSTVELPGYHYQSSMLEPDTSDSRLPCHPIA